LRLSSNGSSVLAVALTCNSGRRREDALNSSSMVTFSFSLAKGKMRSQSNGRDGGAYAGTVVRCARNTARKRNESEINHRPKRCAPGSASFQSHFKFIHFTSPLQTCILSLRF
jgi:hypothetical protein